MIQRILSHKLMLVVGLAIIVRVAVLLLFSSFFAFDEPGTIHGSEAYDRYAVNLNATGVYGMEAGIPDAAIPPVYGYTLAFLYGIFGRSYLTVGVFHTLLDALSIVLLFDISRRLFREGMIAGQPRGEMIGIFVSLAYALYPYLIFQNLTLIDTPLFILELHAFIWLMVLLRERETLDRRTWGIALAGGIVLGVSILTRPVMPPLALLVALWFLFRLSFKQTIVRLLPVAVLSMLMIVPWIVRNYGVFDAFVPMTTTSGANLWQGNSTFTIPVFQAGYDVQWTAPEGVPSTPYEREADAQRFALAIEYWREHPEEIPELLWTKFLVYWSIDITPRYNPQPGEQFALDEDGKLQIVQSDESIAGVTEANTSYDSGILNTVGRPVHTLYFGGLLLLALGGVWLSRREWREVSLLWFVQISMTLIYVIFHPSTRYRVPSDPLLFVLSAYTLSWCLAWWLDRRQAMN